MTSSSPSLLHPGFKVLLMGPTGTGKTHSISTIVESGLEVFYLALEPGLDVLQGVWADREKPIPPNLHWHYLSPKTATFDQLGKIAGEIGKWDLAGLTKIRDPNRAQNNQMVSLYTVLNDFEDQRTGKKFGPIDSWDASRVLIIDGLSALSDMAMEMVTGLKPVRDKPDYGIAQTNLLSLLRKITSGCACHFVLIAHVDREVDDILGGVKLMPKSVGKAILSSIQQPFSDVILTVREGDKFFWDTANSQADLKTRNLPIAPKQIPSFAPIIQKWTARYKAAKTT